MRINAAIRRAPPATLSAALLLSLPESENLSMSMSRGIARMHSKIDKATQLLTLSAIDSGMSKQDMNMTARLTLRLLLLGAAISATGLRAQPLSGTVQVRGLMGSATYSMGGAVMPLRAGA